MWTCFVSWKASRPSCPSSRPKPDCLKPPNKAMPASTLDYVLLCWRERGTDNIPECSCETVCSNRFDCSHFRVFGHGRDAPGRGGADLVRAERGAGYGDCNAGQHLFRRARGQPLLRGARRHSHHPDHGRAEHRRDGPRRGFHVRLPRSVASGRLRGDRRPHQLVRSTRSTGRQPHRHHRQHCHHVGLLDSRGDARRQLERRDAAHAHVRAEKLRRPAG